MRSWPVIVLLLCIACGSQSDVPPAAGDSRLAAILPPAAAPVTSQGPARDSLCDDARTITEQALTTALVADTAPTFAAPRELGRWKGCRFTAQFTREAWSGVIPETQLAGALKGSQWVAAPEWQGDAALTKEFGYTRGDHLCLYSLTTPAARGPADSAQADSTHRTVPYSLELRCTSPIPTLPRR